MKKIILLVFISLIFSNIGFAEVRLIEEKKLKGKHFNYIAATFCIDGYKFVMFTGHAGKSMVQFYKESSHEEILDRTAVPVKCSPSP